MNGEQPGEKLSDEAMPGEELFGKDAQNLRPRLTTGYPLDTLIQKLQNLEAQPHLALSGSRNVTGISMDSRSVREGDLYVALPGAKTHGASFAAAAVAAGAAGILTDAQGQRIVAEAHLDLADTALIIGTDLRRVLGSLAAFIYGSNDYPQLQRFAVTGTNGKTTTTYMLESVFRAALGVKTGLVGTIQILIDGVSIPSAMTTPESVHVHALLSLMGQRGVRCAAMEVSSHAIDYRRVDGVRYAMSGFTNLTQDHLDLHGGMEEYFDSKAQLFTPERTERAVITADDPWGQRMLVHAQQQLGAQNTIRLLTNHGAGLEAVPADFGVNDWAVTEVMAQGLGHTFVLANGAGERVQARTGLPADFNVSNAALAALMAWLSTSEEEREPLAAALASGEALTPVVPGRMQLIGHSPHTIVDFAHNPDGLIRALEAMDRPGEGRVIIVFGATGERDQGKRPIMGEIAARYADIVIVTDDDPHGEDPAPIREAVAAGAQRAIAAGARAHEVHNIAPRGRAIAQAIDMATPDDAVLIAGRGHETAQDVAGVDVQLDDRLEVARAMVTRGFEILPDYRRMLEENAEDKK